jgi:uncharacterized membrane protein YesL
MLELPEWLMTTAEFLTVLVSAAGVVVAFQQVSFYLRDKRELSKRMAANFFWDGMRCLVTLVMGLGLYMNWKLMVQVDILIRPFVYALAVYASVKLYRHYRKVE